MAKFIFLDTNNWIYLSNGFNVQSSKHDELHLKVFNIIQKRVKDESLKFLTNDIILSEWNSNKKNTEAQIVEIEHKYESYLKNLRAIKKFIKENPSEDVPDTSALEEALTLKYKEKIKRHKEHINNVEDLLMNHTIKIDIPESCKLEAFDLAIKKRAPFVGDKRNSMADAVILLSSIEYIKEFESIRLPYLVKESPAYIHPDSYFVSSNNGDFSDPKDKEKIHPHLEPILNRTDTKFYYNLNKLIDSLEKAFLTYEEEQEIEFSDDRKFCEKCEFQHYPTIEFDNYFKIYDPNKHYSDPNQLRIEFPNYDYQIENNNITDDVFSEIRTATCSHCSSEFIECTCGELTYIDEYNTKIDCEGGCGNKFVVHAERDKKGLYHNFEYEILTEYTCITCGFEFESVDEIGNCEECADRERSYLDY